ncbi:hypothetical protein TVAG_096380 [Trichomonas vaginalis G3]|uniref:Uncharacterized protein n=1 Tax=Trichomonas vaginalis (strain ATCC PRA-98 / G3) TaxID=412133 RepID=A2FT32_TRIV3|nr:NCK-associateD protein 1 family [Trichomonas vaginalis G3]EAX91941.1 hypothetical protein TVAG_096380 [Trichomonas vaginalis G3]KAI5497538.1 NCK-associateD protein 1 family [Trichomonas vaginalis G3]|eukprot:XP_001304871.1 hypothetical protein [Trichomonas vaginalis G3]
MTSQLYDKAHILLQHIDLLLAKAESIRMFVFPKSTLSQALLSSDGKKAMESIESLIKAKELNRNKLSKIAQKFISEQEDKIMQIAHAMDYIKTWCTSAHTVLFAMAENSVDFNLRWNNLFTTTFLRLFVAFTKATLFIYMLPTVKLAVYAAPYCPSFNRSEFSNDILDVKNFIAKVSRNPFEMLIPRAEAANKYDFAIRLGQLLSQTGPYLIQALGQWPLTNWEKFNPFTKTPTNSTSTYLDLEHLCLAYIELIRESTMFFCLSFPTFVKENKHFNAIMIAVCSETPSVYLTRQFSVPIKELFDTYDKEFKKYPSETRIIIQRYLKLKLSVTHSKRISTIIRLIDDMTNMASYNPNYVSQFLHDFISLSGFAYYELDCILSSNAFQADALNLINTLVRTAKVFSKNEMIISRTFAYNIATLDASFLNALATNASISGADWQNYFIEVVKQFTQTLGVIDLEQIDKGTLYDVTPFLITHGRVTTYFNSLKTKEKASHLQNIMEHLETIRLHMNFMMDPVMAFMKYCPIHTLWRHVTYLADIALAANSQSDGVGSIMTLFPYFNLDAIALYQSPGELQRIQSQLQNIRASILKRIYLQLNEYISKGSKYQDITKQNQFEHIFNPVNFIINQKCDYRKENLYKEPIWKLRSMMLNMPGTFTFANQEVKCAGYIGEAVTNCIATILFNEPILDPQWVDSSFSAATQFMWPLFSLIGAPFTLKILQCRFEHSCNENQINFLEQVSNLNTKFQVHVQTPQELAKTRGTTQLIQIFQKYVLEFLENDANKCKYFPYSRSYENPKDTQSPSFFSYSSLYSLVKNLGPQAGFSIDWILITHATDVILKLYKIFTDSSTEISNLFGDYQKGGNQWVKYSAQSRIENVGRLLINLGATCQIRKLLRDAIHDYAEQALPGLSALLAAGINRIQGAPNERESLIIEILSGKPNFHYVMTALDKAGLIKTTDLMSFFFFLGLSIAHPKWKTILYDPETEYISNNFHLYPVGLDCLLSVIPSLSASSDQRDIINGMSLFFDVTSKVVVSMRSDVTQSAASISAFIITIDLFPRMIKSLEYGRITKNFPPSIVSEAYRNAADYNYHSLVKANFTAKNGKKGKRKSKK